MAKLQSRNDVRLKRHARVRRKISGTPECPRFKCFPFKCSYSRSKLLMMSMVLH